MDTEKKCVDCGYYADLNVIGQCRRYPKFENKRSDDPVCGEFRDKFNREYEFPFPLLYHNYDTTVEKNKKVEGLDNLLDDLIEKCLDVKEESDLVINQASTKKKSKGRPKGSKNVKKNEVSTSHKPKRGRPPKNAKTAS